MMALYVCMVETDLDTAMLEMVGVASVKISECEITLYIYQFHNAYTDHILIKFRNILFKRFDINKALPCLFFDLGVFAGKT